MFDNIYWPDAVRALGAVLFGTAALIAALAYPSQRYSLLSVVKGPEGAAAVVFDHANGAVVIHPAELPEGAGR